MKCTALIILNYNNAEDTINCVRSVEEYNTAPIKYIVVDNGSTRTATIPSIVDFLNSDFKGRFEIFKEKNDGNERLHLPYISLVINGQNSGYAQGNNRGAEYAYADDDVDNIMILNNDILFVEDIIPQLIEKKAHLNDCAIISPILYKKGLEEIDYTCARRNITVGEITKNYFCHFLYRLKLARQSDRQYILKSNPHCVDMDVVPIELPSGSCMLMNKDFFKSIGSFDPHTFLFYEENIIYKKIVSLGKTNYLVPSLKCIHLGASSTKKQPSMFIVKTGVDSTKYYVRNYENCSLMKYNLFLLSTKFYILSFKLQKTLNIKLSNR